MGRAGYVDSDGENDLAMYGWQANVRRCMAGKKGQAFMWELYLALEALPERVLIQGGLVDQAGACCSLGAVGRYRGIEMPQEFCITDEGEPDEDEFAEAMGPLFGIKDMLAREIMYMNDEDDDSHEVPGPTNSFHQYQLRRSDSPAERWQRMRVWVVGHLKGIP